MNINLAQNELAMAMGDACFAVYSKDAVQAAILRSVRAYSQYRPCLRRMGTASLVQPQKAPANTLTVTGGVFASNMTVTLDAGTPYAETVTIASISPDLDSTEPTGYTTLSLSAPTITNHGAGALILPTMPGLALVAGQDTYALPADFQKPEQESFDLAVGAKLSYRAQDGFYDATATISSQLSGTGVGRGATFGPSPYFGYPIAGNPLDNPNAGIPSPGSIAYRFYLSDNPYLRVIPGPLGGINLDFDYWGCHSITSVPSADSEIITLYGRYVLLSARANALNEQYGGDIEIRNLDDGFRQQVSKNVEQLQKLAGDALKEWEMKLRYQAYATAG